MTVNSVFLCVNLMSGNQGFLLTDTTATNVYEHKAACPLASWTAFSSELDLVNGY